MTLAPLPCALPMPNASDYRDAFQHPVHAFVDPFLKQGIAVCDALGLPRASSGNYASVFYFTTPEGYRYAVRCFRKHVEDRQHRYGAISDGMAEVRSSWKVPFKYLPDEVTVAGRSHPIVCMEWVRGVGLDRYVKDHLEDGALLRATADAFLRLAVDLRSKGIAHGDLQHGNILVAPKGLRLVDYDGMYVPALAGHRAAESGHRNYQHPQRRARPDFFGPAVDDFSVWVIYVSLMAVAAEPALWSSLGGGDECLLLREEDFTNPGESNSLRLLSSSTSPEVQNLLSHFLTIVRSPLEEVPALSAWHRTTRGAGVWKPSLRRPVGVRATGEPWWKEALHERERSPGAKAGLASEPSLAPRPQPTPPPVAQAGSPQPQPQPQPRPQPTPPTVPQPTPAPPSALPPTPPPVPQLIPPPVPPPAQPVPLRSHLSEQVVLLATTFAIAFVLAVALLTLVFAESIPLSAAGVVGILLTLGVVAAMAIIGRRHGDAQRKPPDGGI